MYLKRKVDAYLKNWKQDIHKKPLIIKGARQIGKTETVLRFAEENYANVVYINFALEPKFKMITAQGYDVAGIIKEISFLDPGKSFVENETLIIFDEIQDHPEIATALKSFHMDGRFDVICSGSLLGIHYRRIESNSVGYKMDYTMYSMDFEEFLWAKRYDEERIADMLRHMENMEPFRDIEMEVYKSLFLDYCVLGGMPEVVREYIVTGTFSGSLTIQTQLRMDYEEDIRKYAEGLDQTKILSVYRHVPAQLAKENKKFQYSGIEKSARARNYRGCIEWLADAGVINTCFCLRYPELPLRGNYDESKFKLYLADTGLLISSLDDEAQEDLRVNKNLGVYKGALYENFVAEALKKQGYDLYYYKKDNSTLEEDFFLRTQDELIPVEVKSNTKGSKSLAAMIKNGNYSDISHGIKLTAGNIGYANGIYTFPYFCTFLLKRYLKNCKW